MVGYLYRVRDSEMTIPFSSILPSQHFPGPSRVDQHTLYSAGPHRKILFKLGRDRNDRVVTRMDTPKYGETLKFMYIKYQLILIVVLIVCVTNCLIIFWSIQIPVQPMIFQCVLFYLREPGFRTSLHADGLGNTCQTRLESWPILVPSFE